ncbi:MAG: LysR family transcriptional regulator [Candidatus Methanomethylophilaceae archaeon]
MDIEIKTSMVVNGQNITSRQLEVLEAIHLNGSKTAAARSLGISAPVVHRYMALMEENTGMTLMASTPTGTELTEVGLRILETAKIMNLRCHAEKGFTVACSPVTEELLMSVISSTKTKADLIISDDNMNLKLLKEGLVDIIILDDPVYLFDADDFEWAEIGYMDMIHVYNGSSYIRYRYGAQRIAYDHLDLEGIVYKVDAETCLLSDLINSGKSFFVDEFLLLKKGIKIRSATDKKLLRHSITAVYRRDSKEISRMLKALQNKRLD